MHGKVACNVLCFLNRLVEYSRTMPKIISDAQKQGERLEKIKMAAYKVKAELRKPRGEKA